MPLHPEKIAYFESKGPETIRIEISERKHGQAPDSVLWQEAMGWVEATESKRSHDFAKQSAGIESRSIELAEEANVIAEKAIQNSIEANVIAKSAEKAAHLSARLAAFAILLTIALTIKELIDWYAK
jgi:hypothetical protein